MKKKYDGYTFENVMEQKTENLKYIFIPFYHGQAKVFPYILGDHGDKIYLKKNN